MLPILNTGTPVVPFIDFGSSDETLRNVYVGRISVNLPSPPLRFGSATFTSAFVSDLISDSFFQSLTTNAKYYEFYACMYTPSIHMQISSNGLISFGSIFRSIFPQSFPISSNVIAPYWARINLRNKGIVRYATITRSHPTLSCLLDLTNDLIEELENVEFNATWVLVARWIDVCPYGDSSCFEVSIVNINIMHNRY